MKRKVRDSYGTSGTAETPQTRSVEEAQRPPRGKRVPAAEIDGQNSKTIYENRGDNHDSNTPRRRPGNGKTGLKNDD